jgi:hypothetical protein
MSCDSHRQYLVPSDMMMIERVLAHSNLRQSPDQVGLSSGAARFLIRKFQEGMTDEDALAVALDRHLQMLRTWQSSPHGIDDFPQTHSSVRPTGRLQNSAVSPVAVISDLLGAVNELGRLPSFERAKLLQRAGACIDVCCAQLDRPNSRTIDPDGCDIAFDLKAMASAIDLFDAAEVTKAIRRAVATIGTLADEMSPAPLEPKVSAPLTIGRVWRSFRDWARRGEQLTTAL